MSDKVGSYLCANCKEPIPFEALVSVEEIPNADGSIPNRVDLHYRCDCSPGKTLGYRYPYSGFHLRKLFGGKLPRMPYRAVRTDYPVDEDLMRAWAWEMEQLGSVEELRLYLNPEVDWMAWRVDESRRRRQEQPPPDAVTQ